jgi:hypothetical protein
MSRSQLIALAVVACLAAFIIYLSFRERQPPFLPADADHSVFTGAESCLVCHDLNGDASRAKNHPLGNECSRCHGRP